MEASSEETSISNFLRNQGKILDLSLSEFSISPNFNQLHKDLVEGINKIYFSNGKLSEFDNACICTFRNLREIQICSNKLTNLPNQFFFISNKLEKLIAFGNKLVALPEFEKDRVQNIKIINISQNQLQELPNSFGNLSFLEELDLSENRISTLPFEFGKLENLKNINLSQNQLQELPISFGNLLALENLNLSQNLIFVLFETFSNLRSLKKLNLDHNRLVTLPKSFGNLKKLINFTCRYNQLRYLPNSICNLPGIQNIDLSFNYLRRLPANLGTLQTSSWNTLKTLNVECNFLTSLPKDFGGTRDHVALCSLKNLKLFQNLLSFLPPSMSKLKSLEKITVGKNRQLEMWLSPYAFKPRPPGELDWWLTPNESTTIHPNSDYEADSKEVLDTLRQDEYVERVMIMFPFLLIDSTFKKDIERLFAVF